MFYFRVSTEKCYSENFIECHKIKGMQYQMIKSSEKKVGFLIMNQAWLFQKSIFNGLKNQ